MSRERLSMDFGWRFHRGDLDGGDGVSWVKAGGCTGAAAMNYDDISWREVDLPHDFVVEGTFDPKADAFHGFLPSDAAWYRKTFEIPVSDQGRVLRLEFDGVYRDSVVILNNNFLGRHESGYTSFHYDITDLVNYGGQNVLAVHVDARRSEGWWYEGGGIYRHVWLTKTDELHIQPWGVAVTTEVKGAGRKRTASVKISTLIGNKTDASAQYKLVSTILDPNGKPVGKDETSLRIRGGHALEVSHEITVKDPALWSLDSPNLYRLTSAVRQGGGTVDLVETPFGIRTIKLDPNRGFLLNGQAVKLKGVCCHQDHAGVGVALPDRVNEFRIQRLKETGCNAYRCSHNPPTPELLDACDRLGMFVMDETRLSGSSPECLGQLQSMILRDRNHPSVVLWSLGNEEHLIQGTDLGARVYATMKRLANDLDPTRQVTLAMNGNWGKGASNVVDVQGCNYLSCGDVDAFHRDFPGTPMIFSEAASTVSTRGIYKNDTDIGYVSAYDENCPTWGSTAETIWSFVADRPFVGGVFIWTGFDYRGEPTPYRWPCISSHFGIIDTCGFPKDNFYYYRSWWGGEPVLHILPHWNWPGMEGKEIRVWCHSNCDEVELSLNGRSLGVQTIKRNSHAEWKVPYEPGELVAMGYQDGKQVLRATRATTGAPAAIALTPDRAMINADARDVAIVAASVVDEAGRVVPVADNEITFEVSAGKILGVGNGNPSSHEPDKSNRRRTFSGLAQVIVQSTREAGEITLTATSPGLLGASVKIATQQCAPEPFVPSVAPAAPKK